MKIQYNRITKEFSIVPVILDPKKPKTYLNMLKEADEQCALISKSKIFDNSDKIELIISKDVEIQYFIYSEIANNARWVNQYLPRYDMDILELAQSISKSALSQINKILDQLKTNLISDNFSELKEYQVGNHKTYRYKLDNFNRFVIKPIPEYNQVRLIGFMFHYDDPIDMIDDKNYPVKIKQAFYDIYNDLRKDKTMNPTYLRDKYSKA